MKLIQRINIKYLFITIIIIIGILLSNSKMFKEELRPQDFEIFKNTKAWKLAQAVESSNYLLIKKEAQSSDIVNTQDSLFRMTILTCSVMNNKYKEVEILLQNGANPNILSIYSNTSFSTDTMYALREAIISYEDRNSFIPLLLIYGANKNINCDINDSTHPESAIISTARYDGNLFALKELEKQGGKLDLLCFKHNTLLFTALLYMNISIVNYLVIEKKVDISNFGINHKDRPEFNNILFFLRKMHFRLDTKEYKEKMIIVKYLQNQGLNYWDEPIPRNIQHMYRNNPEYLDKY